ncbi:MAG: hypothetical protein ACEPOZ_06195 [Marinifilaceae bacterium]
MNIKSTLIFFLISLLGIQLKGQVIDSCSFPLDSAGWSNDFCPKNSVFPQWIYSSLESGEYSMGISDPYMDSELAIAQAKVRAVAIACLQQNLAYRSIVDNYSADKGGRYASSKFVSLTNIFSVACIDLNAIEIEETYTSAFDEVFVLIKSPRLQDVEATCDTTTTIRISADLLQCETKGAREESYNFIKLHIRNPEKFAVKSLQYYSYNTKSGKDIVSKINQYEIKFPSGVYRYQPYQAQDSTYYQSGLIGASLNYSFWNAYLDVILNNLLLMTKDGGQVKSLGDKYNEMFKNLFRIVDYQKMKFRISKLKAEGNRLYMQTTL